MNKLQTTKTNIEKIKDRFTNLVGEDTWSKESSFALQAFRRNPRLMDSVPESILESVLNVAQIGLTLNPASKMAYLVPRFNSGSIHCVLEPSYQGLVKLVTDTGSVSNIYAHCVYQGDEFEVTLGSSPEILHKPKFETTEDTMITHAYCVSVLEDGTKQIEVMNIIEIKEIMAKSESYKAFKAGKVKSSVWTEWFSEMARKTVIRRAVKYLPKSDKWSKLEKAIEIQEQDFKPSNGAIDMAEGLLDRCTHTPEWVDFQRSQLQFMTATEVGELIADLKENQVDRIDSGHNYSQTDIKEKLNEH